MIIAYKDIINKQLKSQSISILELFITIKEPNIRYLALECVASFSNLPYSEVIIQEKLESILVSLRDKDISLRRRALDILYLLCTAQIAERIIEELITYSSEAALQIKEELVLKIIILAEKFSEDILFYIDVVVRLVETSGNFITEEIWYRIIQIISGFGKEQNNELQKICANRLYRALNIPHVHETLVKIGSYILSEYGVKLNKDPFKIFDVIHRHFDSCTP